MLYIRRDQDGKIIALHREPSSELESKVAVDREILEFVYQHEQHESERQVLAVLDLGLVRILEDLIDILVEKQVLMITDLPAVAQQKLKERRDIRKKINQDPLMVDDIL